MLGESTTSWREERRFSARAQIVDTAFELARECGVAGLSLRDLARRLGMAAPSLYSYFDSKDDLFDAMFAHGYRELLALPDVEEDDLRMQMRGGARRFVGFCVEDPVRYQLLFQRTIPGFTPSEDSYRLAQLAYDRDLRALARFGIVGQEDLDLVTGMFSGLVSQQVANDPGGDRWVRLVDRASDLLVDHLESRPRSSQQLPRKKSAATKTAATETAAKKSAAKKSAATKTAATKTRSPR